jgi:hypothetical protein
MPGCISISQAVSWTRSRTAPHRGLVTAIAALLLITPIIVTRHLPLTDAPGHILRLQILSEALLHGHPSRYYEVGSFFVPNIAFDVVGLAIQPLLGAEGSARAFFAITLVLALTGIVALNRQLGGRSILVPLLASLLLWNKTAIWGFLNFGFGSALVFWALAFRLKYRRSVIGIVTGVFAGIMLLFCHIFALLVYAAMAVGIAFALYRKQSLRLMGLRWLELVPAFVICALMPSAAKDGIPPYFDSIGAKLREAAHSFFTVHGIADAAFIAGAVAVFALLITARRLRFARVLVPGLFLVTAMYLVMPEKLGSGAFLASRLFANLALLAVAGLVLQPRPGRAAKLLVAITATALVIKQAALAATWRTFDPVIDGAVTELQSLPANAVIVGVDCIQPRARDSFADLAGSGQVARSGHLSAYGGLDSRHFAWTWAIAGQQPLAIRATYFDEYALETGSGEDCNAEKMNAVLKDVERVKEHHQARTYYILFALDIDAPNLLAKKAQLMARSSRFEIYAVP